jgi:RNA polymerase sigma-70 factor, ECF subfamily
MENRESEELRQFRSEQMPEPVENENQNILEANEIPLLQDLEDEMNATVAALPFINVNNGFLPFASANQEAAIEKEIAQEVAEAPISTNVEDEVLVRRVLSKDRDAFALLVDKYKAAVYNHCYRRLHSPEEAEDAAQEVFLRAYNQMHTYQFGRRFSSWLLSIAAHYCIDLLRRRRPVVDLESIAFWKSSDQPEPEELAMTEETRDEVRELLRKLPDKYASVVALRYWQDMSYQEIAEVTNLSVGTVKTRLFRARELLAKELEKQKRDRKGAGSRNQIESKYVNNTKEREKDSRALQPKQVKGNQNVLP